MWAEKGGLDFEGRARWDAWTAVKARPWVGQALLLQGCCLWCGGAADAAGAERRPCPLLTTDQPTHQPTSTVPHTPPPCLQGMAAPKARLEFVRAYYEFPGKTALYSDTRSGDDGKAAPAAMPAEEAKA